MFLNNTQTFKLLYLHIFTLLYPLQDRRGSDPLLQGRALSSSPGRKTSAPSPGGGSRIPVASASSGRSSRSSSRETLSPARTSPARQGSPQRRAPSRSTDNVRRQEEQQGPSSASSSPTKADLVNGGSRIPLPRSPTRASPTRSSPAKQQQAMPTLGWSFSPERMLREEKRSEEKEEEVPLPIVPNAKGHKRYDEYRVN